MKRPPPGRQINGCVINDVIVHYFPTFDINIEIKVRDEGATIILHNCYPKVGVLFIGLTLDH